MATLTLNYNSRNGLAIRTIEYILSLGVFKTEKTVESKNEVTTKKDELLKAYQKMFGKRKDNKYTDNEIFVFNSQRNLAQILEHYED